MPAPGIVERAELRIRVKIDRIRIGKIYPDLDFSNLENSGASSDLRSKKGVSATERNEGLKRFTGQS